MAVTQRRHGGVAILEARLIVSIDPFNIMLRQSTIGFPMASEPASTGMGGDSKTLKPSTQKTSLYRGTALASKDYDEPQKVWSPFEPHCASPLS